MRIEWLKSAMDPVFFVDEHCRIEDPTQRRWIPFRLWPSQTGTLTEMHANRLTIILKARQLGLTWLTVAYALWLMLFRPGSTVLLFSRRDDEATKLLDRLREMHNRLPRWLQATITADNEHEIVMGDIGSRAQAFPTTKDSARSYTASLAIVDEADFVPWLKRLLSAVKPTVDAGGRLVLLSTANKEQPDSEFKRLWREAGGGLNNYHPIFLPWSARPDRDLAWYERMQADYEEDDLQQEYPASPQEALAPRKSARRFRPAWLEACSDPHIPIDITLSLPGLTIYEPPEDGREYLVAADPAEGNPNSDPSAATVFDVEAWTEVAHLHGRFEPGVFANYLLQLARHYNDGTICPERNNHGHAVIAALQALEGEDLLYVNPHDSKQGWNNNRKYKILAVDNAAEALMAGDVRIRTQEILNELATVDASTLSAPSGHHDDRAMSLIIGLAALRWPSTGSKFFKSVIIPGRDPLADIEEKWGPHV